MEGQSKRTWHLKTVWPTYGDPSVGLWASSHFHCSVSLVLSIWLNIYCLRKVPHRSVIRELGMTFPLVLDSCYVPVSQGHSLLAGTCQCAGEAEFLLPHPLPICVPPTICRGFLLTVCVIWGGTNLKSSSLRTRSHSIPRFCSSCHSRKASPSFSQLSTNHDNGQPDKISPVVQ